MLITECSICANSPTDLYLDEKSGQPGVAMRQFQCCRRTICPICLDKQPRFEEYCPYCQNTGSLLKPSGESSMFSFNSLIHEPSTKPSKNNQTQRREPQDPEKAEDAPDVLHFVDPAKDTVDLLSIRYGVPSAVLRKMNGIYADNLLAARKTVLISGEYYKGGVSLSPRPIEGEEMEIKKNKIRRFMVACKVAELVCPIRLFEKR
jgi:hypothetical protein